MAKIEDRALFEQLFNKEHADHRVYHVLRYGTEKENSTAKGISFTIVSKVLCRRQDASVSYRSQNVVVPMWMAEQTDTELCLACAEILHREHVKSEGEDNEDLSV